MAVKAKEGDDPMTEAEFSRQLSELSDVASRLNAESDSINDLLTQAEAQIRALNVGIDVEERVNGGHLCWTSSYVYEDKQQKRVWRLERRTKDDDTGEYLFRHILECTRDERIEALSTLPAIVQALTSAAKSRLKTIEEARKLVGTMPNRKP